MSIKRYANKPVNPKFYGKIKITKGKEFIPPGIVEVKLSGKELMKVISPIVDQNTGIIDLEYQKSTKEKYEDALHYYQCIIGEHNKKNQLHKVIQYFQQLILEKHCQ